MSSPYESILSVFTNYISIFFFSIVNVIPDKPIFFFYFGSNLICYPFIIFKELTRAGDLLRIVNTDIDLFQASPTFPIFVVFDEYWH